MTLSCGCLVVIQVHMHSGDDCSDTDAEAPSAARFNRLLKNELERNSAFFRFLLPEAEVDFCEGPT
jgi:hypothetical protein